MKPHEQVSEKSHALEAAFYEVLDRCDEYRETVVGLLESERSAADPRIQLVHRLEQLSKRVDDLTRTLEDDALTTLVPMMDRLFTLERAERGEDI